MKNILNNLQSKFRSIKKAMPLSEKILGSKSFWRIMRLAICLSLARTSRLAYRANSVKVFLKYLFSLQKNNGTDFVIKYLKAGSIAIQRELGKDGMLSLRIVEKDLPLPRLTNRLPRIIPKVDRALIKSGNASVIRFWLTLFSLYRILSGTPKFKLETITAPFTGNLEKLESYKAHAESTLIFFDLFLGIASWRRRNLSPQALELSKAASPSHSIARLGILFDIFNVYNNNNELWNNLHYLAYSSSPIQTPFMEHLTVGYNLFARMDGLIRKNIGSSSGISINGKIFIFPRGGSTEKESMVDGMSQFAIKLEPAGKVRVFALVDTITQSFLRPLHNLLFEILKGIPNDGTFDQDASVKRSMEKAEKAGKAFSFDLTAATDRVPVALSESILAGLLSNSHYAMYWRLVLTKRPFWFNPKIAEKYNIDKGPYYYAVGQPMGGLSSWAMLAITHHWVVQLAAYKAYNKYEWNEQYEILGDDLVIFDEKIAKEYLIIMEELGCEINLSKSIQSRNRPVFEFAKRTCWGHEIVSGVSLAQLKAGWNVGARTANVLHFAGLGLLTSPNLLLSVLSKNSCNLFSCLKDNVNRITILSVLSAYYQTGKMTLEALVTGLLEPFGAGIAAETVGLPTQTALKVCYELAQGREVLEPWSHYDFRREIFFEHSNYLTMQVLSSALALSESIVKSWKRWVRIGAMQLLAFPLPNDIISSGKSLIAEQFLYDYNPELMQLADDVINWYGDTLGLGIVTDDPAELLSEAQDRLIQFQYDEMESLPKAERWFARVERLHSLLQPVKAAETPDFVIESASILPLVRGLFGLQKLKNLRTLMY